MEPNGDDSEKERSTIQPSGCHVAPDAIPKLAPDPVAAPVAKCVENVEAPAGIELMGVEIPNADDEAAKELKGDEREAAVPNKDENGAELVGVENKEGVDEAAAGVEKNRDPLPLDAGTVVELDGFVEVDASDKAKSPVA